MVRLIKEKGFRENTFYYHLGDGSHAKHINKETSTSVYFKCVSYERLRCPGRAILRIGGAFRHSNPHNHPPDPDFVGERHFRANVLAECAESRFVAFQDIVDQARRDNRYARAVRARMTLNRLRNPMYRARMKSFPAVPHTLTELSRILLDNRYKNICRTVDGDDMLYAGSVTAQDGSHHVAFISTRMLEFMADLNLILADGTFSARPAVPQSAQCFVLVTAWRDAVVPLGWILMETRTQSAYSAVFELLKDLCPRLNPDTIITDWEYAQQKAWQEAFPNAQIQGCLWHLCRAFVKKAQKLRLLRFKTALPEVLLYIRKCCAIALLPARYFYVGLGVLKEEARNRDIRVGYLLRHFFQYVEDKWLKNRSRRRWMHFNNAMHRTNNCCESHNKMLRRAVGAHRPNVYAFIEALARLEHNCQLDIELMTAGGQARRSRHWQSVFANRTLAALSDDLNYEVFRNRNESVSNFLHRAANMFLGAFNNYVDQELG